LSSRKKHIQFSFDKIITVTRLTQAMGLKRLFYMTPLSDVKFVST